MSEYLKEYLAEAFQYLNELEKLLLELEKAPEEEAVRQEALRAAHNLKGISAYMGYQVIADLAHQIEERLEAPTQEGWEELFSWLDKIKVLLMELQEKGEFPEEKEGYQTRLEESLEELRQEDEDLYRAFVELLEEKLPSIKFFLQSSEPSQASKLKEELERIRSSARYLNLEDWVEFLEAFEKEVDLFAEGKKAQLEKYGKILEVFSSKKEISSEIEDFLGELSSEIEALSQITETYSSEEIPLEDKKEESTTQEPSPPMEASAPPPEPRFEERLPEPLLRVEAERVSRVSALADELRIVGYRLQEVLQEAREFLPRDLRRRMEDVLLDFSSVSRNLEEEVRGLKLVPVDMLSSRVERLFRDLVKSTEKEAEFLFEGHDLRVDRALLQEIWPVLVHLLRNAFDHGLETPEEREAAGKPPKGRLRVAFKSEEGWLRIVVADDGRGIVWEEVERRAREKGLSWERLEEVLFQPGFSTKGEADALSGRGFGLDIVKKKVEALRGFVEVVSERGQGTQVILHLPLSAALNRVLLLRVRENLWAIPFYALSEVKRVSPALLSRTGEEVIYNHKGESVKVLLLENLGDRSTFYLLLMAGRPLWALAVPQILGQQEASLRPFPESLRAMGPFFGLALLSGGGVAYALDHRSREALEAFLKRGPAISSSSFREANNQGKANL